jgi:hypothetical protein
MAIGLLALTVAAIFTGAAIYVNVAEQPARLFLDDHAVVIEWKPSYRRGAAMQASLALVGCLLGSIAWRQTSQAGFLTIAMIAPWPWTLIAIKPTQRCVARDRVREGGAADACPCCHMGRTPCRAYRIGRPRHGRVFVGMSVALGAARDSRALASGPEMAHCP